MDKKDRTGESTDGGLSRRREGTRVSLDATSIEEALKRVVVAGSYSKEAKEPKKALPRSSRRMIPVVPFQPTIKATEPRVSG